MKYLKVCQKYSAARHTVNSLLSVSSGDETLHLILDILHTLYIHTNSNIHCILNCALNSIAACKDQNDSKALHLITFSCHYALVVSRDSLYFNSSSTFNAAHLFGIPILFHELANSTNLSQKSAFVVFSKYPFSQANLRYRCKQEIFH